MTYLIELPLTVSWSSWIGFLSFLLKKITFDGHFDVLQEGVHLDVDSVDWAYYDGAVLELYGHGLVLEFHQKSNELHFYYSEDNLYCIFNQDSLFIILDGFIL